LVKGNLAESAGGIGLLWRGQYLYVPGNKALSRREVKTAEKLNGPQPDDSGFTRVDLLALLAAVALLAVLLLAYFVCIRGRMP